MKPSTKRLKIGLVLDDSLDRNDGVQQYIRSLGSWLVDNGHIVHYLVGETKLADPHVHSLSRNIKVRFNGNRLTIPLASRTKRIKALLASQKYDVLHVQMPYSPFMAGKIIRYATPQTTIVGTFHIMPFRPIQQRGSQLLRIVQLRTLQKFDMVASVSPAAQHFASEAFGIESTVIPNMIDLIKWQAASKVPKVRRRLVFLGRLVQRKGCQQLLAALVLLPDTLLSNMDVIVAGVGPDSSKLQKFVMENHLDKVRFVGYVSEEEKLTLLASAELAVFPSLGGESFGIVLIEAMAAGAGVVLGGDNPGYASVLGDNPEALVEPRNETKFAQKLEMFLTNHVFREAVHRKQQALVRKYDVHTVGPQIVRMYENAIKLHQRQKMRQ